LCKALNTVKLIESSSSVSSLSADPIAIMKALACMGIILHHFLNVLHTGQANALQEQALRFLSEYAGSTVQVFFVMSGYGLTYAFLNRDVTHWGSWMQRRFLKTVLPYWIVVTLTFAVAQFIPFYAEEAARSGTSWVAYMLFLRNFVPSSWPLNPSLWFMPVIIGLYLVFPLFIVVLVKHGAKILMLLSLFVTYVTLAAMNVLGFGTEHQNAVFPSFIAVFSIGILAAHWAVNSPDRFRLFADHWALPIGIFCLLFSVVVAKMMPRGGSYNDVLTGTGNFAVFLFAARHLCSPRFQSLGGILSRIGNQSYLIYLIHWPLLMLIVLPLYLYLAASRSNTFILLAGWVLFVASMFLLIKALLVPIEMGMNRLAANRK